MYRLVINLLLLLLFPSVVFADTISIECPDNQEINTEFDCVLNGNSVNGAMTVTANLEFGSGIEFISYTNSDNYSGEYNNNRLMLYSSKNITGDFKIGTLKLKLKDSKDNYISVSSVVFSNSSNEKKNVDSISKTINIKSTDNIKNDNDPVINYDNLDTEEDEIEDSDDTNDEETNENVTIKKESNTIKNVNYKLMLIVVITFLCLVNMIRLVWRKK